MIRLSEHNENKKKSKKLRGIRYLLSAEVSAVKRLQNCSKTSEVSANLREVMNSMLDQFA